MAGFHLSINGRFWVFTEVAELGSLEYPGKEHGWPDEWVDRQGPLNILSP
jgi:hypothetical protein